MIFVSGNIYIFFNAFMAKKHLFYNTHPFFRNKNIFTLVKIRSYAVTLHLSYLLILWFNSHDNFMSDRMNYCRHLFLFYIPLMASDILLTNTQEKHKYLVILEMKF